MAVELIGKKLVTRLHEHGHEEVAAFPSSAVNAVTGAGLAAVLVDADVIVDVTSCNRDGVRCLC